MAFSGDFTPVLAKHTKHLSLVDILSVGVDRMQRHFDPMRKQVEAWKGKHLLDDTVKLVIYRASVEGKLDAPKHWSGAFTTMCFNPRSKSLPANRVESVQRFHERFQGRRRNSAVQSNRKARTFLELATTGLN